MAYDLDSFAEQFAQSGGHIELGRGNVVFGQFPQSGEVMPIFWRCMAAGAVFVPIDPTWPRYLVERAAARIRPRVVIADSNRIGVLRDVFPNAEPLILEAGAARRLCAPKQSMNPAADAAYLFTSGSTGTPKVVVHSRRSLAKSAAVVLSTFGWQPGERLLNLPELHTMSGLRNALVAAPLGEVEWFACPAHERSNFFDLLARIQESRCHHLVAGPSLIRHLALSADRVGNELESVKAIYCTGAAMAADARRTVYRRFGIPVINYYGLTETGGICLSQGLHDWNPEDTSLGVPVGCEARLDNPKLGSRTDGELQIKSSQLMSRYLNDSEATRRRFDGEWLRTGDVMHVDECGRYYLRGRKDLFIKTRGTERIHPEEIEGVLELHSAVAEAAVLGVPDLNGGERVVALAVLQDGPSEPHLVNDLANFVVAKLGTSRKPNEIRFVRDLPRLPNGKLDRNALPELMA